MKGGGLFFCRRGREKSLGIFREVLAAVRTIETFGKDNYVSTGFGGFEDFAASMR